MKYIIFKEHNLYRLVKTTESGWNEKLGMYSSLYTLLDDYPDAAMCEIIMEDNDE